MTTETKSQINTTAIALSDKVTAPQLTSPLAPGAPLDTRFVRHELGELRQLHKDNVEADAKGKQELDKSVQKRLRGFLARGYPQAIKLIEAENRELLAGLLIEHDMAPKASNSGLFIQIANLQMGRRKDANSAFVTPARRNERVGLLYRIMFDLGWKADDDISAKIIKAEGTSKMIAKAKAKDRSPQDIAAERKRSTLVHETVTGTLAVPMEGVTVANSGEWRLALVSVHEGAIRVRKLVGTKDDAAAARERDAYCRERAPEIIKASIVPSQDEVDQDA